MSSHGLLDRVREALSDRYAIERELGKGGTSVVFLAKDLKHPRQVAVKVLRPDVAIAIGSERFLREIAIEASLAHPHILPLHDSGESNGLLYFVMPFVEGESLRHRLEREGPLPLAEAVRIAREVADGLEYAHRRGVAHRDVKPENILLADGHAQIADFGIARLLEGRDTRLTTGSGALGTPRYMSPEQAGSGAEVDERTDIYALGCVLHEMLTGTPPFDARSSAAIIAQHLATPPPALSERRPDIPPEIADAVATALAKEPDDRFPDAASFKAQLTPFTPTPPRVRRGLRSGTPRGGGRSLVALVVTVAALIILISFPFRRGGGAGADDQRTSFLVLAHRNAGSSAEEERLAEDAAGELTRLLTAWREVRAVPPVALGGLGFELGFVRRIRTELDESLALARSADVRVLVTLVASVRGDSALVEATLFDVRSGEALEAPIRVTAEKSDIFAIVAPLATRILRFNGAPEQLLAFSRESDNLSAFQELIEGVRLLERFELSGAEREFRGALALDSTLARAHHNLALTLYWQASGDMQRLPEMGGEIRRLSAAARRHGSDLPFRDSLHAFAFGAFVEGDFENARAQASTLLASGPEDTYAWLLLGGLEASDPWAIEVAPDTYRPRRNPNAAIRAFTNAVRLSPDFFLGYGHLFDVYREVNDGYRTGACAGFERPREGVVMLWEFPRVDNLVFFCPVMRDSIEWVESEEFRELDRPALAASVSDLLDQAFLELDRWVQYAPEAARPHEEMVRWLLTERLSLPLPDAIERHDSLSQKALLHADSALALSRDTVPERLIDLSGLRLATGDPSGAVTALDLGLDLMEVAGRGTNAVLPAGAINPLLATGRLGRTLGIIGRIRRGQASYVTDPVTGARLRVSVEALLDRARVLGALGQGGAEIDALPGQIELAWADQNYDARQRQLLAESVTYELTTALLASSTAREEWFRDWPVLPPLWEGLLAQDVAIALDAFIRASDEAGDRRLPAEEAYALSVLAERVGQLEATIRLLEDIVSRPLGVTRAEFSWGLRALARLRLGRHYEAGGDPASAISNYESFVALWEGSDEVLQPMVQEALEAIDRLEP